MARSPTAEQQDILNTIVRKIRSGAVLPIVSNAFRNDRIFAGLGDEPSQAAAAKPGAGERRLSVGERLARRWAAEVGYPMGDGQNLARVTQFSIVETRDVPTAKGDYTRFIKNELIALAEASGEAADLIGELRQSQSEKNLAELAEELDTPRFPEGCEDPLRLLARLPLPIYVTTSYYDFLERALEAEKFPPRTQVCWWGQRPPFNLSPEHELDLNLRPSPQAPLVYHIHGLEQYASSLVLSEDDYLDFVMAVSDGIKVPDQYNPVIPQYIVQALTQSSLILLGYRLQDWDFRVLFQGVIKQLTPAQRKLDLVVQLSPEEQGGIGDCEKAREYLKKYLLDARFDVMWCDAEDFVHMLWETYRQGRI